MAKIKKMFDGCYEYRGVKFDRHDRTPSGYWGRWSTGFGKNRRYFSYRWEVLEYIDNNKEKTNCSK
jgi:hypothetical protein